VGQEAVGWDRCRRERGRRKWILIPLILFMLITRLSPAKDFHNNGLVLPLYFEGPQALWARR